MKNPSITSGRSSQRLFQRRFILESTWIVARLKLKETFRVIGLEIPYHSFKREIGKDAVVFDIFNMPFPLGIYGLEQSVRPAVELRRKHTEFLAQFDVERGRRFYPPVIDVKERIAVVKK